MQETELLDSQWNLKWLGLNHSFFTIDVTTVVNTWIIIGLLIIITIPLRFILKKKESVARYLVTSFTSSFMEICQQTLGIFSFAHFSFITSLFIFIFLCNTIIVVPWLQEPTKNLNTTFALGLISFVYTQIFAIKSHGIINYIKEYFSPIFVMFPLHVLGKLATIISMSFRLFGNIFGGAIITHIYMQAVEGSILWETLGLISGTNLVILLFFGLFEGFLQAFVFSMLTLTYLSIALQDESDILL